MSVYTIEETFLDKAEFEDISDVLMVLANRSNKCRIALDRNGHLQNLYWNLASKNESIRYWLNLINYRPQPYAFVDANTSKSMNSFEIAVEVCSSYKGKRKLVVHSKQELGSVEISDKSKIEHNSVEIKVYDKTSAKENVNKCCCTKVKKIKNVIKDSTVITKSKIKHSFKNKPDDKIPKKGK